MSSGASESDDWYHMTKSDVSFLSQFVCRGCVNLAHSDKHGFYCMFKLERMSDGLKRGTCKRFVLNESNSATKSVSGSGVFKCTPFYPELDCINPRRKYDFVTGSFCIGCPYQERSDAEMLEEEMEDDDSVLEERER